MACSSDVVKKVMRFKLQLTDTAESATVLKILQKLKDLDITLDILAETGIGKTVNSLRRHEQAGEFAKTLVRGWKKLLSKDCRSHADDGDVSETMSGKDQNCAGSLTVEDSNNNCLTSHSKSQDFSDEALFKIESRKTDSEKQQFEEHKGKNNENQEKQCVFERHILEKKVEVDEIDNSFVTKKKKNGQSDKKSGNCDTLPGNRKSEDTHLRAKSDSWEKMKINSDSGRFELEKELDQKLKQSKESSKERKETFSFESSDKYSETLKLANVRNDDSSGILRSFDTQRRENKKTNRHVGLKYKEESENEGDSKHKNKKAKMKHKGEESKVDQETPSVSFESCLNYDVKVYKRKERCGVKKPSKKIKTVKEANKYPGVKTLKSPVTSINISPPKVQESVMDLMNTPLPVVLPDYEKPSSVERFDRKVERESDFCDVSEESAVFTGQRLNRKMQVYSGAKTIFLPTMMSLSQQCIRTLQNNINLLYETGGVPFEILEPVLERCTPGQLLRIEECNPIYIGVTDHLWGKHCQRDFKDSKLQEYESWKEMYVRLSEERERKFKRLTKSIVSAHSNKPKGRQVKMAFIHTVAKPPRDVRIQQEIHGTAVQQPPQPRCSVKVQEEKVRSSSSSAAGGNTQDPRKKTRVAPMMAKSLKAFKKQLGRR